MHPPGFPQVRGRDSVTKHMSVWCDVQAKAGIRKRRNQKKRVRVLGLDGAYVLGWGEKRLVLVGVDMGDGQVVALGYVDEYNPPAVLHWLEGLVKNLGVSVIVTDDLTTYRLAAEKGNTPDAHRARRLSATDCFQGGNAVLEARLTNSLIRIASKGQSGGKVGAQLDRGSWQGGGALLFLKYLIIVQYKRLLKIHTFQKPFNFRVYFLTLDNCYSSVAASFDLIIFLWTRIVKNRVHSCSNPVILRLQSFCHRYFS